MFDLEKAFSDWRKQMLVAGIEPPVLEELETHLREDINHLLAAGNPGEEAFRIAAIRVGRPRTMVAEFAKTKAGWPRPMMIGSVIWTLMAMLLLALLGTRYADGKLSLLLVVHVFTVTAGYCTAFLAGALGIYHILGQGNQVTRTTNLTRTISISTQLSVVFVVIGLLTGMVWSDRNLGHFWTNDPREIGALGIVIWLAALSLIQNLGRLSLQRAVQLSVIGNMLVALAWFGAGMLHHGYSIVSYWPLDAFLGLHLFFLGMSITRNLDAIDA